MSFQSPPIARLKKCWTLLSELYSDSYCDFIEMSELMKSEIHRDCIDYTPPSIPLFNDLIDDLKERCGSKMFEIRKHRMRSNWSKRDTLAVWVDQQIADLVNRVDAKDIRRSVEKIEKKRKSSNDSQNKGILKRLLSKSPDKEFSDTDSVSNFSDSSSRLSSFDSDFRVKSRLSSAQSPEPSCKNIWSVQDFHKLREHDERLVLEEIARGLVHYQRNASLFCLKASDRVAKHFLLLQGYQG